MRTAGACNRLAARVEGPAYVLEGDLDGWMKAGLPLVTDKNMPIDVMRQVQIAAGSLVVLGVLLGVLVAPGFYALSAFVGAGLVFAGTTGFCGMARLLLMAPWNRRLRAA
jgi:rhodanese-related sulfurtransferase